jgi:NAD(P)-dependent dehydrogenase (short-subunit alcohol dehydrogenase family)
VKTDSSLGKLVLVTGASSGIGRHAALQLACCGYRVIATARKASDLQALQGRGLLDVLQLDLGRAQSVEQAIAQVMAHGVPEAVLHNAGFGLYGAVEDLSRHAMEEQFAANLFGAHQINHALLPRMRGRGSGRIVFVSSVLGVVAMRGRGLYVASKFAMEGLADTLRLELHGSGIHVCLIEPGPIETRFRANAYEALARHVDVASSAHAEFYRKFVAGLMAPRSANRFALPDDACFGAIIKALEARRPAARYRVTTPAKVFPFLKRILPTAVLDRVLRKG